MLIFLLFLLPVSLIAYAFFVKDKKIILPIIAGLLTAVVVCACRFFFTYEHRLVYDSFSEIFSYYVVKQAFLPLFVVSAVYGLISRDAAEFKVKNFFPLLTTFYAIYLPYCVITASEYYYQAYDIFLKPVIYLAMLVMISFCLIDGFEAFKAKKIVCIIFDVLIIGVYAFYPAVSDALYAINYSFAVILLIGIIYSALPVVYFILSKLLKK